MTPTTPDTPVPRRPRPAGLVLVSALVGMSLASLLSANSLVDLARRQPDGPFRTVAVAITRPLAAVSSALRLDVPRRTIDAAIGRRDRTTGEIRAPKTPPATAATSGFRPRLDIPPTMADPAQAWIIGDSFMELFGPKLSDEFVETGVIEPEVHFEFTSGLSRPDFFDWPAHIRSTMRTSDADIVVLMFGGNDGQNVTVDDVRYEAFTRPWWDLYRRRVEEVMDAVRGHRLAYWVGLPIMKDATFRQHAREMNVLYEEEAKRRPWMRYVSSWETFATPEGRYSDYLPNLNGDLRLMRYEDGAHFTPSGALELALDVSRVIEREWKIPVND